MKIIKLILFGFCFNVIKLLLIYIIKGLLIVLFSLFVKVMNFFKSSICVEFEGKGWMKYFFIFFSLIGILL